MQEYIYMVMNGTLYNPNEVFKESEDPKISIVITVYNGEGYLETTLLSIQNQDFKDIEIIMVDDCSKDNSVKLIKELMMKDPRVKLYQNEENKGMLYTKTRGVLHAKGKYVLLLDEDDIYAQKDAFSTLYHEAEKNNLDLLGFGLLTNKIHIKKWINIQNYMKTDIIYQPNLLNRMYNCDTINCKRVGGITSSYLVRTDLFVN
jgi:glycosyltransferase involved in cell wall biosynthesis